MKNLRTFMKLLKSMLLLFFNFHCLMPLKKLAAPPSLSRTYRQIKTQESNRPRILVKFQIKQSGVITL